MCVADKSRIPYKSILSHSEGNLHVNRLKSEIIGSTRVNSQAYD